MTTRRKIGIIAASLLAIFIILIWLERMEEYESLASVEAIHAPALRVSGETVSTGPITQWVMAEGRAEAVRKSFLQFEESGKVVFIGSDGDGSPIREGMRVNGPDADGNPGQLLARIDSRDKHSDVSQSQATYLAAQREIDMLRATMKQAEDDLAESKRDHDRKKKLFDQKFLAQSEYDEAKFRFTKATAALSAAKLNIASAQARLNSARAELGKAVRSPEKLELRAPFDGIVARMNIREGDYFEPGDVVHANRPDLAATAPITVIDPTEMEVTLHLPERTGRMVRTGQQAVVAPGFESWAKGMTLETAPKADGTVYSVSPQIDGKRRAIRIKVRLHQADTTIPDGMFTACWINVASRDDALRIPLSALLHDGGQPYVFVYASGAARRHDVALGLRNTEHAEVIDGLAADDIVICKGRKKLVDGTPVDLIEIPATQE